MTAKRQNGRAPNGRHLAGRQDPGRSAETPAGPLCDHPDCDVLGEYRAPAPRQSRNRYYLFCLDHVREYNKAWNFCAGMDEREIERQIRLDTVWRRPTWPLGGSVAGAWFRLYTAAGGTEPATPEHRALGILELGHPVTLTELKARYKELVKIHHPDKNGGDRLAEERLKEINHAYATLRRSLGA